SAHIDLHSFPTRRSSDLTSNKIITTLDQSIGNLANAGAGGRLFSDNFESGGLSLWSEPAVGATADTVHARSGKYAGKINASSNLDRKSTRLNSSHSQISY